VEEEAPSIGTELLASIQDAFDTKRSATLATATLLEALAEDEEAPWAAWNRGKPMTAHQLAKRLSEFGIKPTTIRIGLRTPKGYRREQFEEAFRRYLSAGAPQTSATPQQPSSNATYKDVGPQLVPP
jgi:transposase InsO family protein